MSAALVPGLTRRAAPSSCTGVASNLNSPGAFTEGLLGPSCSSGSGGGEGNRGELGGAPIRAGDLADILWCLRTILSALMLHMMSLRSRYAFDHAVASWPLRTGGMVNNQPCSALFLQRRCHAKPYGGFIEPASLPAVFDPRMSSDRKEFWAGAKHLLESLLWSSQRLSGPCLL